MLTLCAIQTYLDINEAGLGIEETIRRCPEVRDVAENRDLNIALREWRNSITDKPDIDEVRELRNTRFIPGAVVDPVELSYVEKEMGEDDEVVEEDVLPDAPEDEPELTNPTDEQLRLELVYTPVDDGDDKVDPVLSYGGFKFLANSSNEDMINRNDLGDVMEDGLYEEFVYIDGDEDRDILDVVEMGDGGLDIITFDEKTPEEKIELGLEERMANLDTEDSVKFNEIESPVEA